MTNALTPSDSAVDATRAPASPPVVEAFASFHAYFLALTYGFVWAAPGAAMTQYGLF
jgi:hypothetical protein